MAFVRWTLYDPNTNETFTFHRNPSEGGDFGIDKSLGYTETVAPDGLPIFYQGQSAPKETSIKGVFVTVEQRNNFMTWADKNTQLLLTNDLGEQAWIFIKSLKPTRKRVASRPYKADYDMSYVICSVPP